MMTREAPSAARGLISLVPAPPRSLGLKSKAEIKIKGQVKVNGESHPNDGMASPVR
jgi:hypothetical protein